MYNFDDSSSGEEINNKDVEKSILDDWKNFEKEVLEDLQSRIVLKPKGSKKNSTGLLDVLSTMGKSKNIAQQSRSFKKTLEEYNDDIEKHVCDSSARVGNLVANPYGAKYKVGDIKKGIKEMFIHVSEKFTEVSGAYNKLVKNMMRIAIPIDILFDVPKKIIIPAYKLNLPKNTTVDTVDKVDELKKEHLDLLKKWCGQLRVIVERMVNFADDVVEIHENSDEIVKVAGKNIELADAQLSFTSHYLGASLFRHPAISDKYKKLKKELLSEAEDEKNFHYNLLASKVVEKTIVDFNNMYSKVFDEDIVDFKEMFLHLSEKMSEGESLRVLMKNMNGVSDYLLFRMMYECVDKKKISYSKFIGKGSAEIAQLMEEMNPLISLFNIKVMVMRGEVDENDYESNIVIKEETYAYREVSGYISKHCDYVCDEDVKNHIFSTNVSISLGCLYNICRSRKFKSLKKYYLEECKDELIEDTILLIKCLDDTVELEFIDDDPTEKQNEQIRNDGNVILVRLPGGVSNYPTLYFRDNMTKKSDKYYLMSEVTDVAKNLSLYNCLERYKTYGVDDFDYKDKRYVLALICDALDKNELRPQRKIFKGKVKNKLLMLDVLVNNEQKKDVFPGQDILEQAFLLVFRRNFYDKFNFTRTVLPDSFSFVSKTSVDFLSNLRLCNRSLTRRSRNLLQSPSSKFQIKEINSGSEPIYSCGRLWYFTEDNKQEINKSSFFAVDRQVINSKHSEKKEGLLSREHYVCKIGSYSNISSKIHELFGENDTKKIAAAMRKSVVLQRADLDFEIDYDVSNDSKGSLSKEAYFASLSYLLFGVEAIRNPAVLITNHMLLDLLAKGKIAVRQMFGGCGIVEFENESYYFINGLMPTSPKSITARSRELNNIYHRYMPYSYIYPGDLSRNSDKLPSATDTNIKLKVGLNDLINREALIMKIWFECDGFDYKNKDLSKITTRLVNYINECWGLQINDIEGTDVDEESVSSSPSTVLG